MIEQNKFLPLLVLIILICFSAGCSQPLPEALATATSVPATATQIATATTTLTPTNAPTPMPTVTPTAIVAQANATFTGEMTISDKGRNGNSSGIGEIELKTSANGAEIVSATFTIHNISCAYAYDFTFAGVRSAANETITAENMSFSSSGKFPISDGNFVVKFGETLLSGHIISPVKAIGEITIIEKVGPANPKNDATCDYGKWEWNASVK